MTDQITQLPSSSTPEQPELSPEELAERRRTMIILVVVIILVVALLIAGLVFLLHPGTNPEVVSRIRDVFIIVMALESLLIGAVLVILMLQLARLTNLLQHEIKPILDSTNETISTLRGTTEFISDNLAEPVIKLNEYIAAFQRLFEVLGIGRRKP